MHQHRKGFTIVELLIVIVVIGILAAISIVAYNGIQQRAREAERQSDIKAISTQLEMYFVDNGEYPLNSQMGNATWIRNNMPNIANDTIVAPNAPSGTVNSIRGGIRASLSNDGSDYGYYTEGCSATGCPMYQVGYRSERTTHLQMTNSRS